MGEKFKISVGKLRKLQKAGYLRGAQVNDDIVQMRSYLSRGLPLTLRHLVKLHKDDDLIDALGTYRRHAQNMLDALGNLDGGKMMASDAVLAESAGRGDPDVIQDLIKRIKEILPENGNPVSYYWLAIRFMLVAHPNREDALHNLIGRAFLNCRKQPEFKGWWLVDPIGSRQTTFYVRPKKGFDI